MRILPAVIYVLQFARMERRKVLMLFLLQLACGAAVPLSSPRESEILRQPGVLQHDRMRRKIGNREKLTGALEYMTYLRDNLTDSNGNPRTDEEDPTSVWCILDQDILQNTYREKVRSGKRCTTVNRFVFSWQTLAESQQARQVPVQRGTLRAFLQTIPRLLRGGKTVPMRVTINATLLNSNSSQSVFAGEHHINVTSASNGWVDLNITQGIQELWPPHSEEHVVELTLTLSVGCKHHKKVPATFVNPAEIPLKNAKRRERHRFLQPMLLVYLSDMQVKEMVKNGEQQALPGGEDEIVLSEGDTQSGRNKRSAGNDFCAIEDFTVNFHNLQLYYVLVPFSYNAKRCAGSCSHTMLTRRGQSGTNHAKIMASAKAVSQAYPSVTFQHPPRDPCCVPTKYKSLSLIVNRGEGIIELEVYPAMVVEECGCR